MFAFESLGASISLVITCTFAAFHNQVMETLLSLRNIGR